MYLPNYRLWKSFLGNSLNSTVLEHALADNMWNRRNCSWNPHETAFIRLFSAFSGKLIGNICPIVLGEILGMFVNTLTADGKYPVQGCENLQLPIQMQLSEKRKTFSEFFVSFLESTWKFKHFEKKHDNHS